MTIDEYDKLPPEEKEHFTLVRDSHEITGGEWLILDLTELRGAVYNPAHCPTPVVRRHSNWKIPGKRSTNAQFHS